MSISLNKRSIIANRLIEDELRSGVMPTSSQIFDMLTNETILEISSDPTKLKALLQDGNKLDHEKIMNLIEGIELDTIAMRETLDESWDNLAIVLEKVMEVMPVIKREADVIGGVATRSLALTPGVDGVSVGRNAIAISTGFGFGTADGLDMAISNNIDIDLTAGALVLKRNGTNVISASTDDSSWTIDGEYSVSIESSMGDPSWTVDGNFIDTWTVRAISPSKYGRVSLRNEYSLGETQSPLTIIEVLCPDFTEIEVEAYIDPDGLGNFEHWAVGSGSGRIILDGPVTHASRVRLVFSKFVATESFFVGSSLKHEYGFKISEVTFSSASCAEEGNAVSDSIPISYDLAMTTSVDIDKTVPSTSEVNVFVARDIPDASNLSDFSWIPVDKKSNMAEMMNISNSTVFIAATNPKKIQSGAGIYSNSIYSIGKVDGTVTSAYDGYNQFEIKKKNVYAEDVAGLPGLSTVDFGTENDISVGDRSGCVIDGANFYRISTSVFSNSAVSHQLDITLTGVADSDRVIYVNGIDVTSRLLANQRSVGFVAGRNEIVILATTGLNAGDISFAMGNISGAIISIDKATVVNEMSMSSSECRVAQVGQDLQVNHNPTGRMFLVGLRNSSGTRFDAIRIRIQMKRGVQGESPQIRKAFITTGV